MGCDRCISGSYWSLHYYLYAKKIDIFELMRFVSVLLVASLLFLSSFSGMIKTAVPAAKTDCCKKAPGKALCHHKPAKDQSDGCEKQGCAMLFSCCICGFVPVPQLRLQTRYSALLQKPVPLYKIGDLSTLTIKLTGSRQKHVK